MSVFDKLLNAIINSILEPLFYLAFAVATLVFLWGGVTYIWSDAAEARTEGRVRMIMGIIGLVIMLMAVAIVQLVANTIQQPLPTL